MSMGLMDTIENIAQIGGEIACKTFVDHDIKMGRTALMEFLPPKFLKQNISGVPSEEVRESLYQLRSEVYQVWLG